MNHQDIMRLQRLCAERAEIIRELEEEIVLLKADHACQLMAASKTISDLSNPPQPKGPKMKYILQIKQANITKMQANALPINFKHTNSIWITSQEVDRTVVENVLASRIPVKVTRVWN